MNYFCQIHGKINKGHFLTFLMLFTPRLTLTMNYEKLLGMLHRKKEKPITQKRNINLT